jgi:hypothetical protein
MGLLEYQAMPSLRDAAHDGGLCTFSNRPEQVVWYIRAGGQGPSITYKITPCCVTLLQPTRRAAVLDQPSILRSLWWLLNWGGGGVFVNWATE